MADIARWSAVDPMAEVNPALTIYRYGFNNPIMFTDPNGMLEQAQINHMWNNSGTGVTSWSFNTDGSPKMNSYNYMNDLDSQSLINSLYDVAAGHGSSTIHYWTGNPSVSGYMSNNELYGNHYFGTLHQLKVQNNTDTPWDAYKDWADWGSSTMGGGFDYIAKQRTALYNSGYWIDNLGNQRSVRYAGRANGSLIGLRSDYVLATAKYGKYAKRAG